jgi:hypothetical protein
MPADEVGPFDVEIDYETESIRSLGHRDLLAFLEGKGAEGATTAEVTRNATGKRSASEADEKRITRLPTGYEREGVLRGDHAPGHTTMWKHGRDEEASELDPLSSDTAPRQTGRTPERDTAGHSRPLDQ